MLVIGKVIISLHVGQQLEEPLRRDAQTGKSQIELKFQNLYSSNNGEEDVPVVTAAYNGMRVIILSN
jgi:hypothetical protein